MFLYLGSLLRFYSIPSLHFMTDCRSTMLVLLIICFKMLSKADKYTVLREIIYNGLAFHDAWRIKGDNYLFLLQLRKASNFW